LRFYWRKRNAKEWINQNAAENNRVGFLVFLFSDSQEITKLINDHKLQEVINAH